MTAAVVTGETARATATSGSRTTRRLAVLLLLLGLVAAACLASIAVGTRSIERWRPP